MKIVKSLSLLLVILMTFTTLSLAKSAQELNKDANKALVEFHNEVYDSKRILSTAKAYLVFPDVKEAGFFLGGKYAEGVLHIDGVTKAYYSLTAASVGFQAGVQTYSLIIIFTSDAGLRKFIRDDDWEADMDFNIAMANWNSEEELDEIDFGDEMIGFVFDSKGLMGNFSMEGTKFKRITP